MRQIVAVFALIFVVFVVRAEAQTTIDSIKSPTWSANYAAAVGNRYVGTTVCAIFANQTVMQHSLTITHASEKTSVSATVWNSTGVTPSTWFDTYAYETDVDLNIAHRIGKYDIGVGGWVFFLNPTAKTDVLIFDGKVSRNLIRGHNTFAPFTEAQWYGVTNAKDSGTHGGAYPMAGIIYGRPLSERISLSSQFHANYDATGGFGKAKGKTVFSVEAGLRFAMNASTALTARAGLVGSFNDPARDTYAGRPRIPVFNIGISKSF